MRIRNRTTLFVVVAITCGFSLQDLVAQTVSVDAEHRVVANTDQDGRSWLTLSVTVTNHSDQDFSSVRLLTSPELSPKPGEETEALILGSLPMDSTLTMEWTFETVMAANTTEALPGSVTFTGEATDAYGDFIAFPVTSVGGAE